MFFFFKTLIKRIDIAMLLIKIKIKILKIAAKLIDRNMNKGVCFFLVSDAYFRLGLFEVKLASQD